MTTYHHPDTQLTSDGSSPARGARSPLLPAAKLWPWVPGLLLAGLIGTQITVLASALRDPGFSTESDYYRKAVDWDAQMVRQRRSRALGWTARASAETLGAGLTALELRLSDARGEVVPGAQVRGVAFHNARAAHELEMELTEVSAGVYRALLGHARPGLWETRITALRGADAFEATLRFEVQPSGVEP
jgi:nitrogen fixation protein FixH